MEPLLRPFTRKALLTIALAAAALTALAVLVKVAQALLVFFAALLIALVLRGLGDWLAARTPLSPRRAVELVIVALVAAIGVGGWLLAPGLIRQLSALVEDMPRLVEGARRWLESFGGGVLATPMHQLEDELGGVAGSLLGAAGGPLRALIYLAIAVISGVYLALSPGPYVRGLVRLFPPARRELAAATVREGCHVLQRFLLGRLVSMLAVGVITGAGLWLLRIPLASLLGLIAGALTFVPYAGPLAAAVPIALVALSVGPAELGYAMVFYAIVQNVEGFVITPVVQERAVALPPLVTLLAEVVLGLLFGPIGVIVSVPLAALVLFGVRTLYVERLLERMPEPG